VSEWRLLAVFVGALVTGGCIGWLAREAIEMDRRFKSYERKWIARSHTPCTTPWCQHAKEDHDHDGICQVLGCQCYYFKP
jgi:hypothetical protein